MYYMIDIERNTMLNNFMADMPKAIQMGELITMQAKVWLEYTEQLNSRKTVCERVSE